MARGSIGHRDGPQGRSWYYIAPVPDRGDGKPGQKQKRGFRTKKDAEKALREFLAQVDAGTYRRASNHTVETFLEEWLQHKKRSLKPSSHTKYARVVEKQLGPALGARRLDQLTGLDIDRYYSAALEAGTSPAQLAYIHIILNSALRRAVKWKLIPANPAEDAEPPEAAQGLDPEDRKVYALEDEQARALLRVLDGPAWLASVIALGTGMRRGEVLGLRWKDVDFSAGIIQVRQALHEPTGKAGTPSRLPTRLGPLKSKDSVRDFRVAPELLERLRQHRAAQAERRLAVPREQWQDLDLVVSWDHGGFIGPSGFGNWFRRGRERIGLPNLRFHDLRHTFATNQLRSGVDISTVSRQLGHSAITITLQVYSHVLPDMQERAALVADATLQRLLATESMPAHKEWLRPAAVPETPVDPELWEDFLRWRREALALG